MKQTEKIELKKQNVCRRERDANLWISISLCCMYVVIKGCRWAIGLNTCFFNRERLVYPPKWNHCCCIKSHCPSALLSVSCVCKRVYKPHSGGNIPRGKILSLWAHFSPNLLVFLLYPSVPTVGPVQNWQDSSFSGSRGWFYVDISVCPCLGGNASCNLNFTYGKSSKTNKQC